MRSHGNGATSRAPISSKLLKALGLEDGRIAKIDDRFEPPYGYYRIASDRRGSLFVKILPEREARLQAEATAISDRIAEEGGPCLASAIRWRPLDEGFLWAWPLRETFVVRRDEPSTETAVPALAEALADLHRRLGRIEPTADMRAAHRRRTMTIDRWKRLAQNGSRIPGPYPDETRRALTRTPDERDAAQERQLLHGDVHPGNVLADVDGRSPLFIDFENTAASWGSPILDVAFAIDRFELRSAPRDFHRAYEKAGGPSFDEGARGRGLAWTATRNLALLCEKAFLGPGPPKAEWRKQLDTFTRAAALIDAPA